MDYKLDNLKEKVYKNFIVGEYGSPRIPTYNEVINKINEFTTGDYIPITNKNSLSAISLSGVSTKFSNIIDDIAILFGSVEEESRDVLDQLTNSLKEQNGVKRELNRIASAADDIMTGKLGEEHLQYNFTESFDDVGNINQSRSDPVDLDAGVFTIRGNGSNIVNMNHYINRRIQFSVVSSMAPIIDQGFVGDSNAENILSSDNPSSITYRVKTTRPASLTVATTFQLRSDGQPVTINSVGISLDSTIGRGFIRLYYQNGYQWLDVPGLNLQEIKGDNVVFSFGSVDASYIKLEFIKDLPDTPTSNEYYITIYDIAIEKSSVRSTAVVYSEPIVLTPYSTETPVVNNIACTVDADIPPGCKMIISVAPDIKMSGQFVNSYGNTVYPDSTEAVDFNPQSTGYVFLSDMMNRMELSGLIPYRGFDFSWQQIQTAQVFGNQVPQILEFNNTSKKALVVNSLYNAIPILYGDRSYTGPYPENGTYTGVYLSGWCNSSNPAWATVLSGLVSSGLLFSGIDVASYLGIPWDYIADGVNVYSYGIHDDILSNIYWSGQWLGYGSGIPYNFFNISKSRTIHYGDYYKAHNGWWRPYSYTVTQTGIADIYASGGYLAPNYEGTHSPDFYFNGLDFYKIYKFSNVDSVIESSIKLYRYEERPSSSKNDDYQHQFKWTYKTSYITKSTTLIDQNNTIYADFNGYFLAFPNLDPNEDYSVIGVNQIKQTGTNFVLASQDYIVVPNGSGAISGVLFSPLAYNYPYLSPKNVSFDINFNYRVRNKYLSTWVGFAIVSPGIDLVISVTNKDVYQQVNTKVISSILVEDLDGGSSVTLSDPNNIKMEFNTLTSKTDKHYKISIFCMADEKTGFSALINSTTHFVPRDNMIISGGGIRFVAKLTQMKVCNFASLVYDTSFNNDNKCALIDDATGERYIVIKKPSKDNFPGYYFNSPAGTYYPDYVHQVKNKGHYIRQFYSNGIDSTFTTGSSGTVVFDATGANDKTWNDGNLLTAYPNSDKTVSYNLHSTYGYGLHLEAFSTSFGGATWAGTLYTGDIDPRAPSSSAAIVGSIPWGIWISSAHPTQFTSYETTGKYTVSTTVIPPRGFLFYPTAENLPVLYSISYNTTGALDDLSNRFLYKLELDSDGKNQITPKVRAIRFEVNVNDR